MKIATAIEVFSIYRSRIRLEISLLRAVFVGILGIIVVFGIVLGLSYRNQKRESSCFTKG